MNRTWGSVVAIPTTKPPIGGQINHSVASNVKHTRDPTRSVIMDQEKQTGHSSLCHRTVAAKVVQTLATGSVRDFNCGLSSNQRRKALAWCDRSRVITNHALLSPIGTITTSLGNPTSQGEANDRPTGLKSTGSCSIES